MIALNRIPDAVNPYPILVPVTSPVLPADARLCLLAAGSGTEGKAALEAADRLFDCAILMTARMIVKMLFIPILCVHS